MPAARRPRHRPPYLPGEAGERSLRVCLDLNIFVASLLADQRGRSGTAAQLLVDCVRRGESTLGPIQLVISWGMLGRLRRVLEVKLRVPRERAAAYAQAVAAYTASGPQRLDPLVTLGGTGVIAARDEEDLHVLETAIAGRADFLVTGDMDDFVLGDTRIIEPGRVLEYDGPGGRILIAHPFRMAEWIRLSRVTLPETSGDPS